MLNLNHLKIETKLRLMSLVTLLCIATLGFVSNYFFQTSKVLGIIINAERVHNNSFQEGVEDYYKYLSTANTTSFDSAVAWINTANQMAYIFATIDQVIKLPKEKCIDILFETYKEAYGNDRENAWLMRNRLKVFQAVNKVLIAEAQ